MLLPETIDTARLQLRKPLLEDAEAVYDSYGRDPEVTRYLTWRPNDSLREALNVMLNRLSCWENGAEFSWLVTPRDDPGNVLGMISAGPDKHPWRWSLGYVLARQHWGQGYTTEATRAVLRTLFAQPGIERVWAVVDEENHASARVLEKAGLQREGILRRWSLHPNISTVPRDCWCFSVLRESL